MNDKLLVELTPGSDMHKFASYFILNGRQSATIEDVATATGMSANHVRHYAARMKNYFANVISRRRGDVIRFSYANVDPEVSLLVGNITGGAEKVVSTSVPAAKSAPKSSTDIVVPNAPAIPDKDKYQFFVKPQYFARLASKVVDHKLHVSLSGPPGIGKSVAFEVLAMQNMMPLVNVNADSGLRSRQLVGSMTDLGRFEMAQFAAAVVNGWWAKIDEANGADPDAIIFLNSLLAPPYQVNINGRSYGVHPNFRLCITYNPGLIGTKPLPESLKDRLYPFRVKFPTAVMLEKMLVANGLPNPDVDPRIKSMVEFAMAMATARQENRCRFDITLRRLTDAWTDIQDGATVYDALCNSCVERVDNVVDSAAVLAILDGTVQK